MFDEACNTNMQGNIGLGSAIAYFTRKGFPVCIPLTDSQSYDLIVDFGIKLERIQVKTSSFKSPYGIFAVSLNIKGGNRSGTGKVKKFSSDAADFVFVLTANGDQYLIPSDQVGQSISLGSKYDKYLLTPKSEKTIKLKSEKQIKQPTNQCQQCGNPSWSKFCSIVCTTKSQERVIWPDNLADLVAQTSKSAVARKLGVSDKAVAKRLKRDFQSV